MGMLRRTMYYYPIQLNGTAFVPNSVIVNGVTQPGVTPTSINIGSINANTTITASFQVVITSIPNPNPISNSASISYNFIVDPNASPVSKTLLQPLHLLK